MARASFGGGVADFVVTAPAPGDPLRFASATLTMWDAETGGSQVTDLLLDGDPVTTIAVGRNGLIPTFQGPEGVMSLWADGGGGGRSRLDAVGSIIEAAAGVTDGLMTAVASDPDSAFSNQQSASTVQQVAGPVPPSGDVRVSTSMLPLPRPVAHNAFPSIVRLADGTYLAAWRGGADHSASGGGVIYTSASATGVEWSEPTILASVVGNDLRDPGMCVTAAGTVLVSYYNANLGQSFVRRSTDGGVTFGAATLLPFTWDSVSFVSAPPVQFAGGTILQPAYGRNAADGTANGIRTVASTDDGVTWGSEVVVAASGGANSYTEPNIVVTGATSARMMIRDETSTTTKTIRTTTTTDTGSTWAAIAFAVIGTGNPHLIRFRSGVQAMMYRHLKTGDALVRTSRDGGATWGKPSTFGTAGNFMAYAAAVETARDGQALMVWSREDSDSSAHLYAASIAEAGGVPALPGVAAPAAARPASLEYERFIPASAFLAVGSTVPALTTVQNNVVWAFDSTNNKAVHTYFRVPDEWNTYDVDLIWANATVTTGVVVWDCLTSEVQPSGSLLASGTDLPNTSATVPGTTNTTARTTIATGLTNTENRIRSMRVIRGGAVAEDTYADGAYLLGVMLVRRS